MAYLSYGGMKLSDYMPGFESELPRVWGEHRIPGQRGKLLEDLGEGSLATSVVLQFVGAKRNDYTKVAEHFQKNPRADLVHPLRGTRRTAWKRWREKQEFTKAGDAVIVEISFEDAVLSQPDDFKAGVSAAAQEAQAQGAAAEASAQAYQAKVNARPDLALRARVNAVVAQVHTVVVMINQYAAAAKSAFQLGVFNPASVNALVTIPPLVSAVTVQLNAAGRPLDIQSTVRSLEMALKACTDLDRQIKAAQPIPIETTVMRTPGQSIYSFVQQWYPGVQRVKQREIAMSILRLNRQIKRPSLIPMGTVVTRPSVQA